MSTDYWGAQPARDHVLRILPEHDSKRQDRDDLALFGVRRLNDAAEDACREAVWAGAGIAVVPLTYPLWNGPLLNWHSGSIEIMVCTAAGIVLYMGARALRACHRASEAQFQLLVRYLDRPLEGRSVPERPLRTENG